MTVVLSESLPGAHQRKDDGEADGQQGPGVGRGGVGAGVPQGLLLPDADVDVSVVVAVVVVAAVDAVRLDAVLLQSDEIARVVVVEVASVDLGLGVEASNQRSLSCGRGRGRRGGRWLNRCHEVVEDLAAGDPVVGNSEDHLHVVSGASTSNTAVKILRCGR